MGVTAPAVQAASSARLALPLSVSGNRVVDANNQTVVLNGIHRDGPQVGADTGGPRFPSADEISWIGRGHAGSWNANVVRVPVSAPHWTGSCPAIANDPVGYRTKVDAEIQQITDQGMLALLDLHTIAPKCKALGMHTMPDPDVRVFWDSAAAHYAGNPLVAFELYNEPHYVDGGVWLAGTQGAETMTDCKDVVWTSDTVALRTAQLQRAKCINNPLTVKWEAVGMQELYNRVTGAAPGHLVLADGLGYAGAPPTQLINAAAGNLVYALHPYTCSDPLNTQHDCAHTEKAHANTASLDAWRGLAGSSPVLVTEVGWPTYPSGDGTRNDYTDGATFYSETIAYLQAQNPKWGIVGFAFDGSSNGTYDLITDTASYAPNSTALPLFNLLSAQP
jgi:hypothetical protein